MENQDTVITVPDSTGEETVVVSPEPGQIVQAQTVQATAVSALEQRIDDMSTTDLLLLMIFCLLFIRTMISLFTRKWGAYSW